MGQDQRLLKGLFKDSGEIDQPSNTWRYAINALMNEQKGSVSNESGTTPVGYLIKDQGGSTANERIWPHFDKVIGAIEIDFNRTVLFVCDTKPLVIDPTDASKNYYPQHSIMLWDGVKSQHQTVRLLYKPVTSPMNLLGYPPIDLNFSEEHPIEGTFRIDSKEDVIVYWTDDNNPPRAFNISRQIRALEDVAAPGFGREDWLYGIDPYDTHDKHIEILNLFPASGLIPAISTAYFDDDLALIGTGGGLLTGAYYLALGYVDEDFVETNYLTVSNPVSIVPQAAHTRPTTKRDGAKPGTQTSKSITWSIVNLNTDYKFIKAAVIRKKGDETKVFKLSDKVITGNINSATNTLTVTFAGTENYEPLDIKDVMIDTVAYDTAKTITQLDNVLYMGNLTGSPDLGYQKYANNIKLNAHKKDIEDFDQVVLSYDNLYSGFSNTTVDSYGNGPSLTIDDKQSYRDPIKNTFFRGYRRGEVYAFYIAFILNDGSMSYAYHIPGREPIQAPPIWPARYSATFGGATNRTDYEYWELPTITYNPVLNHQRELHSAVKIFHFYDVSEYTSGSDPNARPNGVSRNMRYWHNINETYPYTKNSEVWDRNTYTDSVGTTVNQVQMWYNTCSNCGYDDYGLQGMNVRHHHMPSHTNPFATMIDDEVTGAATQNDTPLPPQAGVFSGTFRTPTNGGSFWHSREYWQTTSCNGTHQPLGAPYNINALSNNPNPPFSNASNKVIATEDFTTVTVNVRTRVYNDNKGCMRDFFSRIRYKQTANSSVQTAGSGTVEVKKKSYKSISFSGTCTIDAGGSVWVEGKGDQGGSWAGGCPHKGPSCGGKGSERHIRYANGSDSYVQWAISIGTGASQNYDVNLIHNVSALGISLEDINIPKSYYNKIQGFRIYYAKRGYINKRMLGQAPIIPMKAEKGRTGVCLEAINNTNITDDVMEQTLAVASSGVEPWISKEAWADVPSQYALPSLFHGIQNSHSIQDPATGNWQPVGNQGEAYRYMSFYDFNLLRNHSSLAPATHLELTYISNNWTWNGPTASQDKKMLSEIITETSGPNQGDPQEQASGLYKIRERWGWDDPTSPQNCYAKDIKSAIFAGGKYIEANKFLGPRWLIARLLGQKAKTYLPGDTILDARSLGFSGSLINTYGDSTVALKLKSEAELPALYASPDGTLGATYFSPGVTNLASAIYGQVPAGPTPQPVLANPYLMDTTYNNFYLTTGQETTEDATANMSYIANLCAFKTDVYRSVDSQELIWTGFEVTGEDLNNFFFDDEKRIKNYQDPTSGTYGSEINNPNFGQPWHPGIRPFLSGAVPVIIITDPNATTQADIEFVVAASGVLTGVTINNGGAGYVDPIMYARETGKVLEWIKLTPTITGGVITAVNIQYAPNTFKIETGECMRFCSDASLNTEDLCVTGLCVRGIYGTPNTAAGEVFDDPSHEIGGNPTPITDATTCEQHGWGWKLVGALPPVINKHYDLTLAEFNAKPGTPIFPWSANIYVGGGHTWTEDCGGIYGGDTIISRHGIAVGQSVLEQQRDSSPNHAIHYHIVESEDNINFRHTENNDSQYFPNAVAAELLRVVGSTVDATKMDNMLYDSNFSSLNDVRTAFPLPTKNTDQDNFPTRTIRSVVNDASGIRDNYRVWLANQFKDLPKNRGELWKLATFSNLLYFHMEESLFKAAGKQTMQMGDGTDAFVGSGDIFKQEPSEIVQTEDGYGGTQSQYAALTTRYGYFFVDRKGKKVFMMKDQLLEISALGMENWFIENMNYELIKYGASELDSVDNPIQGLGYHSIWDPFNKRIILTKRDLIPTLEFTDGFNLPTNNFGQVQNGKIMWNANSQCFVVASISKAQGLHWSCIDWGDEYYFEKGGWTISYYPDQGVWCSFHSYVPYIYFNTTETFYSLTDQYYKWTGAGDPIYPLLQDFFQATGTTMGNKGIWEHNTGRKGLLYQDIYLAPFANAQDYWSWDTFEIEIIHNHLKSADTLTASFAYMMDVIRDNDLNSDSRILNHGFTNFYVYNTFQISGNETSDELEYLVNVRRIGNSWKVNRFRDMAADVVNGAVTPNPYYVPDATWSSGAATPTVTGVVNPGTQTTAWNLGMFVKSGMSELVNGAYLDLNKSNLQRRKFIDKWIGIRLIYDNITNNLLNLYSTSVESRQMYR